MPPDKKMTKISMFPIEFWLQGEIRCVFKPAL